MKLLQPLLVGLVLLICQNSLASDEEGIRFFEQKIRPVLVQHCYSCHSAEAQEQKKLQGALFLDSAAGIAAGGESGATLVKGRAQESLLLKALMHDGFEMPPSGKLPDDVIADFAKWIDIGAPDPREGTAPSKPKREINLEEGRQWWAFQPLHDAPLPDPGKPVDGFVRQIQQAHGLKPNRDASKEVLIRRAYFDLVGLPPTPEQIDAFLADTSPNAFASIVNELLDSPAYGERWARHWLDAARFAESGGYEFDGFRPGAFHYRDWVIRALNADMPYDEFVRMQLAGDLLSPNHVDGAAATGFLVAGPYPGQITAKTVERIRYDQLDDMMMTMGGSMLGLTLGCARCHEHKYDPIPHQDYYSLAASLAQTVHGTRTLESEPAATNRALETYNVEGLKLQTALDTYAANELPGRFYAWHPANMNQQPDTTRWQSPEAISLIAERSYLKQLDNGLIVHDGAVPPGSIIHRNGEPHSVAGEERYRLTFHTHQKNIQALRLDAFTDKSLPQRGPGLNGDGSFQLAEIVVTARPMDAQATDAAQTVRMKASLAAFEDTDQPLGHAVDGKPETAWVVRTTAMKDNAAILEFESPLAGFANGTEIQVELQFRDAGIGRLRVSFSVEQNPASWAGNSTSQHIGELRAIAAAYPSELPASVRPSLARWLAPFDSEADRIFKPVRQHAAAKPRPMLSEVYTTVNGGQDVFYLRRGEVENKQDKAQPGYLQVLWRNAAPARPVELSPAEHPRISVANWITNVETGAGPLLARVIVNRLWQHHLGTGIARTPNDFGVQGERPSHPELLEYLASELVRGGWRLKPLHRAIMLSDVYQQSAEVDADNLKIDPDNRLLWHFQPRRLEAETIRDALLAVGGNLDRTMYGASVLDDSQRRSVYLRVKRSELIPVMTMFDAPEPTQSIGERSVTTVPTQALALMNSPLVRQQAERLYQRIKPTSDEPLSSPIQKACRIAFGRLPSDSEMQSMTAYIERQISTESDAAQSREKAIIEFCHVLLCLNEFVYVD